MADIPHHFTIKVNTEHLLTLAVGLNNTKEFCENKDSSYVIDKVIAQLIQSYHDAGLCGKKDQNGHCQFEPWFEGFKGAYKNQIQEDFDNLVTLSPIRDKGENNEVQRTSTV